jgi:hypothetical protein
VMGYCHISLANYVAPVSTRVIDKSPVYRLTESELPGAQRSLIEARADLPGLATGKAMAAQMLRALLTGDEGAYARLSEPDLAEELDQLGRKSKPEWMRVRLKDINGDFTPMRRLWSTRSGRIDADTPSRSFIEASDLADREGTPRLIHCWCIQPDCTGKWPVTRFDADNLAARPYRCIATGDYLLGPEQRTVVQASVPYETAGFAEPGSD